MTITSNMSYIAWGIWEEETDYPALIVYKLPSPKSAHYSGLNKAIAACVIQAHQNRYIVLLDNRAMVVPILKDMKRGPTHSWAQKGIDALFSMYLRLITTDCTATQKSLAWYIIMMVHTVGVPIIKPPPNYQYQWMRVRYRDGQSWVTRKSHKLVLQLSELVHNI